MKWFIVVIMMWQSDGTTPLWIPFEAFETKDECVSFVKVNQYGLFERAIQQYEGKITQQQISSVPEKGMQELLKPIDKQIEEEKRGV